MVVSTRLTPRKSERETGKLVEESKGGSTLPRKKNNAKRKTTTPMKSSPRQQKSKATPLPKTAKRSRPPTPVPSARKDRTTPIRSSTKKNESSIPLTSSTRKRRPTRTPTSRTKRAATATSPSSPGVQPHGQHTMEKRVNTDSSQVTTPPNAGSPLTTPQSKLLPLNPNMSGRISRITLGRGKSATPLKEWRVMDAAKLKSLLKSRKCGDRESAMAQLSFDGTPLQDMIYSDFEEVLEYMNIKVKKGNTVEELRLILAEIMIETIEESMDPIDKEGEEVLLVEQQQQQQREEEEGGGEENSNITEKTIANEGLPSYLSPGTDVEYKGVCIGDMTNVQLHDYLVELDMKRGGSKAVRATRLREGLLRLKAETLAGIYNGKAFDDMSEFELREALEYEGEPTDGTVAELKTCLMGLLFDWATNDVHLIRKESEQDKYPPPLEGIKHGAGKKEEEMKVAATDTKRKGTTSSTVNIPDLKIAAAVLDVQQQTCIENGNVEDLELKEQKKKRLQQLKAPVGTDVSIMWPTNHSEDDEGVQKQQQPSPVVMEEGVTTDVFEAMVEEEEKEGFISTNHHVGPTSSRSSSSIISKDVVVDIKDKQLKSQQLDTTATFGYSTTIIKDTSEKFILADEKLHKMNERMEDAGAVANSTAQVAVEEEEEGGTSKTMVVEKDESNMNISEEISVEEISFAIPARDSIKRHELDSGEELLVVAEKEEELPVVVKQKSENQDEDYLSEESDEMTSNKLEIEDKDFGIESVSESTYEQEEWGGEVDKRVYVETTVREDETCIKGGKTIFEGAAAVKTTNDDDERGQSKGIEGVIANEEMRAFSLKRKNIESEQDTGIQIGFMETTVGTTTTTTELRSVMQNSNVDSSFHVKPNVPLKSAVVGDTQIINDDSDRQSSRHITYNTEEEDRRYKPDDHMIKNSSFDFSLNRKCSYNEDGLPSNAAENRRKTEHRTAAIGSRSSSLLVESSPLESLTSKQRVKFWAAVQGRATITPEEFDLFSRALGRTPPPDVIHRHEVNNDSGNTDNTKIRYEIEEEEEEKWENKKLNGGGCSNVGVQKSLLHNKLGSTTFYPSNTQVGKRNQLSSLSTPTLIGKQNTNGGDVTFDLPPHRLKTELSSDISEGKRREEEGRSFLSESNYHVTRAAAAAANSRLSANGKTDINSSHLTSTPYNERDSTCVQTSAVVDHSSTRQHQQQQQQRLIEPVNISNRKRRVSYGPCTGGGRSGLQLLHGVEGGKELIGGGRLLSTTRFFPRVGTSSMSFTRVTKNFSGGMELSPFSGGRKNEDMQKLTSSTGAAVAAAPVSTRILAQQAVALRILEAVQSTTSPQESEQEQEHEQESEQEPEPSLEKSTDEQVTSRVKENIEKTPPKRVEHNNNTPPSSAAAAAPCVPSSRAASFLNNNSNSEGEFIFRDPSKVDSENKNLGSFPVGSSTSMQRDGKSHHLFSFSGPTDSAKRRKSMEIGNRIVPPPQTEKNVAFCDSSKSTINVLSDTGAKNVICNPFFSTTSSSDYDRKRNVESASTILSGGGGGVNAPNPLSKMNVPLSFDMRQFGPKRVQWKCTSCSVVNEASANKCPCCETCKPDEGNNKGSVEVSNFVQRNAAECDEGNVLFGIPQSSTTIAKAPTLAANELGRGSELCNSNLTNVSSNNTTFASSGFKGFSFGTTPGISNLTASSSKDFSTFVAKPPIGGGDDGGGSQSSPSFATTAAPLLSGEERRMMMASVEGASNAFSISKSVKSTGDKMSPPLEPFSFGKTKASGGLLFAPPVAGGTTSSLLTFGKGPKPSLPVPSLTDLPQSSTTTMAAPLPPFKQHS